MKIYCVECWSNDMRSNPWDGAGTHDVHLACICKSFEEARQYCIDNSDFGGVEGKTEFFFPWHWVIFERNTNDNEYFERIATLNPDGTEEHMLCDDDKCCNDCPGGECECIVGDGDFDTYDDDLEPIKCDDESEDEYIKEIPDHSDSYEKWREWFETTCDHCFDPSNYETWNGAIETIAEYVKNEFDIDSEWLAKKIRTFKL